MGKLEGRTVLVTGGSSGNGSAICQRFAEEGAIVVVGDIAVGRGEELADELSSKGHPARFVRLDVTNETNVAAIMDATVEDHGHLDIVVCNAGIQELIQEVDQLSLDEWTRILDVNLTGVFLCNKHAVRHMKNQGHGSIINMSSGGAGINASPGVPAYSASKGGVTVFTKAVALQVAEKGIRVNALCPGMIDTPMMDKLVEQFNDQGLDGQAFVEAVQPINRLGTPAEVANVAVFLASDDASLITGVPILVDGGMNAGIYKSTSRD